MTRHRFARTLQIGLALLFASASVAAQQGAAPPQQPVGQPGRGQGQPPAPVVTGPPAPVPPEVKMPNAAEVEKINAGVRRLIDTDKSADKALMKKYESLLMLPPVRLNTAATFTQTVQRRGARHEGFVETARAGNIDLLLHGDSITDWWVRGDENKAVFEKYFGKIRTANFAIAGDRTEGVLWGLQNGEGQGFQPKAVMLMIGTNNTNANTGPEIAEGIGAIVLEMRKDFPDAKILLLAIFPRGNPGDAVRDRIAIVNQIIARLNDNKHVFYMDIGPKFLDEKGVFLPNAFLTDNLHPATYGYEIWGQAVQAKLAELLKK